MDTTSEQPPAFAQPCFAADEACCACIRYEMNDSKGHTTCCNVYIVYHIFVELYTYIFLQYTSKNITEALKKAIFLLHQGDGFVIMDKIAVIVCVYPVLRREMT